MLQRVHRAVEAGLFIRAPSRPPAELSKGAPIPRLPAALPPTRRPQEARRKVGLRMLQVALLEPAAARAPNKAPGSAVM